MTDFSETVTSNPRTQKDSVLNPKKQPRESYKTWATWFYPKF